MELKENLPITNKGIDDALKSGSSIEKMNTEELDRLMSEDSIKNSGNQKPKIMPAQAAEDFLIENQYVYNGNLKMLYYQEDFYFWNTSKYSKISDKDLENDLYNWFRADANSKFLVKGSIVKEVIAHLKAMTVLSKEITIPSFLKKKDLPSNRFIPLTNGLLSLDLYFKNTENCLLPHDSDLFSLCNIPTEYNPSAKCPTFLNYLAEVQPNPEIQKLLQQWMGYNLVYTTRFEKFMLFVGEGANGKSVFCTIMTALIGPENISAVSLEAFDEKRSFSIASTLGKLSNIVEDLNEIEKAQEGVLKKFISGGVMTVERKYQNPFVFTPTARLTYATNILPRFSDRSNGIWRRLIIVPWGVVIPPEKQDRRLGDLNYWKKSSELPGILNWALEGLKILLQEGKFITPKSCEEYKYDYKLESNPALVFLKDRYIETSNLTRIPSGEIYMNYVDFCKENGHRALSSNNFSKEIPKAFPSAKQPKNAVLFEGKRKRVWEGLGRID